MIDVSLLTEKDKKRRVLVRTNVDPAGSGELTAWDVEKDLVWVRQDHTKYSQAIGAKYCLFIEAPEKQGFERKT